MRERGEEVPAELEQAFQQAEEKLFVNVRNLFGGNIRQCVTGAAPIAQEILEFFYACGIPIMEGYGMTETATAATGNLVEDFRFGSVGKPFPGVEVKIAEDGEVLSRGPHIMKGYWNDPKATAEAVRDSWLYTGDLGSLDEEGFLTITGRKKELLVMSSGKKVVPPHIEGLLLGDNCIDQVVVHGEGRNFLTALIVPNWDNLRRVLAAEGVALQGAGPEALAIHPAVRALLRRRMDAVLADVASWERVKKFIVLPRPFTVAAEELTVSLKLRRNVVFDKYRRELDALYQGQGGAGIEEDLA